MHINKYILGLATLSVIGGLGWLSVEALSISNSSFDKGAPVFKSIFLRSEGKDTINGSTNPEKIRLDNNGLYISPGALPGSLSNVLKLRADGYMQIDPVRNGDFIDNAITSNHIINYSINNSNFSDLTIMDWHIANNTITKSKFDSNISFATGTVYTTNNICTGGNAMTGIVGGTGTCSLLGSGNGLPTCSEGQSPIRSGGAWICDVLLLGPVPGSDPYRTGSTGGWIANSNAGNVGIGTSSPSRKLTVQGTTKFLGETEEQVYCYANDTWVSLSSYNEALCAGCSAGFSYNPSTQLCEQNSCVGSGGAINGACGTADGQSYSSAPTIGLCSTGNASSVQGTGPWTWSCNGINGGTNASCSANLSAGGGSNIYIINRGGYNSSIIDVNSNGLQFFAVNNGFYPLNQGSSLDGVHGGLSANEMDYNVSSTSSRCMYTFINNEADASTPTCNPTGYAQQTQGVAGNTNGTIWAPAFSHTDRVDIVLCDGICN